MDAAAAPLPLLPAASPPGAEALPPVAHEVVDPADVAAVAAVCQLVRTGQADLYGHDEADLALLPTLTRMWMRRGHQRRLPSPGTTEKRSVSAAIDLGDGKLLWRTDASRTATQFTATLQRCAHRSPARGRVAILLVDNARSHQVGKTGIVRRALDALAGRVVLVFLPNYSPHLQPAEKLWRQWRPNVTHNHTRTTMADLKADSDAWLKKMARRPRAVLQALSLTRAAPSVPQVA